MAIVRKKVGSPSHVAPIGERTLHSLVTELKNVELYDFPLNVDRVAEYLGLEVTEELMDGDISGYLEFKAGQWVVGLNALHHRNRQRFTLAHELAHFVLHRNERSSFVDQTFARREGAGDPVETQADRFAADLLMPEDQVRALVSQGVTSLKDLAARFQVSQLAMRYRVKNLGFQVK
jgi:Zn-dependent peptidase ImmA (M78 family)